MQQTGGCVGKLNVADINADRSSRAIASGQCCLERSYHSHRARVDAVLIRPVQLNAAINQSRQAVVS